MTSTLSRSAAGPTEPTPAKPARHRGWFAQYLLRLHFFAGLFIGPFILLAALSGAGYAAAPTIDKIVYHEQLTTTSTGPERPLAEQIASAQRYVDRHLPGDVLVGIKPAAAAGQTSQVMFSERGLLDGQVRSVWIDPVTADAKGDFPVFSTALPVATWFDFFHRTLYLGDVGRLYSETAASWLGIIALAGLGLWVNRIRKARRKREYVVPVSTPRGYRRVLSWHSATGIWLLVGALFLSATGITWSLHAGGNVSELRSALRWETPSLTTDAPADTSPANDGTAQRGGRDLAVFDDLLAKARTVNIHADQVEIDVPTEPGQAWVVSEIKRSYPTAVSQVAIDPTDMSVVSRADWPDFPIIAKLVEWGIDTHMGLMWGLANQILLFVLALGIASMVVWGYVMWWQRRPTGRRFGRAPRSGALARAPWWGVAAVSVGAIVLGVFLPTLGVTLLAFVLVDVLVTSRTAPRPPAPTTTTSTSTSTSTSTNPTRETP